MAKLKAGDVVWFRNSYGQSFYLDVVQGENENGVALVNYREWPGPNPRTFNLAEQAIQSRHWTASERNKP